MSRLQDALNKLQARRATGGAQREVAVGTREVAVGSREAAVGTREAAVETREVAVGTREVPLQPVEHSYGGKPLTINFDHLRRVGLTAAEPEARRLAEQYRTIKRPLLKNASSTQVPSLQQGNLLLVTSSLPNEGKTFTCLNLCFSLAREQDWSVVLVDGDSSKPHLSRLLGAEGDAGLMDLLRDSTREFDSIVMPTDVPNLSFLPAGTRHRDAVELLASSAMETLCDRVARSDPKRMIVFDSPPLLLTSEAPALAAQVSQIVVVVKANKTPQRALLVALGRLDPTKPIGLLLNQAGKGTDEGKYSGHYYGYDN